MAPTRNYARNGGAGVISALENPYRPRCKQNRLAGVRIRPWLVVSKMNWKVAPQRHIRRTTLPSLQGRRSSCRQIKLGHDPKVVSIRRGKDMKVFLERLKDTEALPIGQCASTR